MEKNDLKKQRNKIRFLRFIVLFLLMCTIFNLILPFLGYNIVLNLITSFFLGYWTYTTFDEMQKQSAIFTLQRYIFEDGFKEKYDKENGIE